MQFEEFGYYSTFSEIRIQKIRIFRNLKSIFYERIKCFHTNRHRKLEYQLKLKAKIEGQSLIISDGSLYFQKLPFKLIWAYRFHKERKGLLLAALGSIADRMIAGPPGFISGAALGGFGSAAKTATDIDGYDERFNLICIFSQNLIQKITNFQKNSQSTENNNPQLVLITLFLFIRTSFYVLNFFLAKINKNSELPITSDCIQISQ